MPARRTEAYFAGCLLGGAVGDALGAPVEFLSLGEIEGRYGTGGIGDFDSAYGRVGAITDDTQMTLFTAEGVLRAKTRATERGICSPEMVMHHAYVRWLHTQGERSASGWSERWHDGEPDGWLVRLPALHSRRAPGNTCLSALRVDGMGMVDRPINDSKGCGGVMRMAPVGLSGLIDPFESGCAFAAITHGHPSGYLAAGALALMIREIADGGSLGDAVAAGLVAVEACPGHEETSDAIRRAMTAAATAPVGAATIESLGGGWVAEEALSIAIYCALVAGGDFERGVRLAVNHGGDSDSTGAITGNLLGALLGVEAIPRRWLEDLELRPEIESLAMDLLVGYDEGPEWRGRYPGW
jgi:ADP-ribosyl-[dinitrogen reductase] hydrolase